MNYKKTSFYKTKNVSKKKEQEITPKSDDSAPLHKNSANNGNFPVNFNDYDFSVFLFKKTEKLTTALYMVTSFLSDNEPLKWKLREKGIVLLSGIATARDKNVSEMENVFASHSFLVEEITSFLEIATSSKLISEMNFSILKKEYFLLKHFIDSSEYTNEKSGKAAFSSDFFHINEKEMKKKEMYTQDNIDTLDHPNRYDVQSNKLGKGQTTDKRQTSRVGAVSLSSALKSRNSSVGATTRTLKDIRSEKLNRRDTIVKLFKTNKNKRLTIKDISHHVSNCSEKTIQRELTALVLVGILNKEGERRWSKYSLK